MSIWTKNSVHSSSNPRLAFSAFNGLWTGSVFMEVAIFLMEKEIQLEIKVWRVGSDHFSSQNKYLWNFFPWGYNVPATLVAIRSPEEISVFLPKLQGFNESKNRAWMCKWSAPALSFMLLPCWCQSPVPSTQSLGAKMRSCCWLLSSLFIYHSKHTH